MGSRLSQEKGEMIQKEKGGIEETRMREGTGDTKKRKAQREPKKEKGGGPSSCSTNVQAVLLSSSCMKLERQALQKLKLKR